MYNNKTNKKQYNNNKTINNNKHSANAIPIVLAKPFWMITAGSCLEYPARGGVLME